MSRLSRRSVSLFHIVRLVFPLLSCISRDTNFPSLPFRSKVRILGILVTLAMIFTSMSPLISFISVIFSSYGGKFGYSSSGSFLMVEFMLRCASSSLKPCFISAPFIFITSPSSIFLRSLIFSVHSTTLISPVSSITKRLANFPPFPFLLINFLMFEMRFIRPIKLTLRLPVFNSDIFDTGVSSDNGLFSSSMYSPTITLATSSSPMKLTSS